MYKELWKIVRSNIRIVHIALFSISSIIGLYIIFLACASFSLFKSVQQSENELFAKDFLTVGKKISAFTALRNTPATFSQSEIEELAKQDFFNSVDAFVSSQFEVTLLSDSKLIPQFRTDFFFEAVPNAYIHNTPESWYWHEGMASVPVILPYNFLALYNFGYAPTRGLPQLSESIFRALPLKIRIYNETQWELFSIHIIGFSKKINTVLVPISFLQWANAKFAPNAGNDPSRLIIDAPNAADSRIAHFFAKKNLQIDETSLANSKLSFYLTLALSLVGGIGIVITLLALWLLVFNFQLIIERNKDRIRNLYLLGFSRSEIQKPYLLIVYCLCPLLSIIALCASQATYTKLAQAIATITTIETPALWISLTCALVCTLVIIAINSVVLRKSIKNATLHL
ncbi:MAG: hypothetical protein LBM68_02600 [Bacteroidales bacterium]|jgi:hypothetical protein|nr:hypothetical protein [Bacteroidales bacterium]